MYSKGQQTDVFLDGRVAKLPSKHLHLCPSFCMSPKLCQRRLAVVVLFCLQLVAVVAEIPTLLLKLLKVSNCECPAIDKV